MFAPYDVSRINEEAKRFGSRVADLLKAQGDKTGDTEYEKGDEVSALKRAGMDLKKELARLSR